MSKIPVKHAVCSKAEVCHTGPEWHLSYPRHAVCQRTYSLQSGPFRMPQPSPQRPKIKHGLNGFHHDDHWH